MKKSNVLDMYSIENPRVAMYEWPDISDVL